MRARSARPIDGAQLPPDARRTFQESLTQSKTVLPAAA
jgi:hypothetical protein